MSQDIKLTNFVTPLGPYCRKRHQHHRRKNEIIKFVIQLEILIKEIWHPVIRYDTAHGYAHCDILNYRGKIKKIRIQTMNYKEALIYADEDINKNWYAYCERYLKEAGHEQ